MKKLLTLLLLVISVSMYSQKYIAEIEQVSRYDEASGQWIVMTLVSSYYVTEKESRRISLDYKNVIFVDEEFRDEESKLEMKLAEYERSLVRKRLHAYNLLLKQENGKGKRNHN